jgi:hypothetical protein
VIAISSIASPTSRKVAAWNGQAGPPQKSTSSAAPITHAVSLAAIVW